MILIRMENSIDEHNNYWKLSVTYMYIYVNLVPYFS